MPWIKLSKSEAHLWIYRNGRVVWNEATQILLKRPKSVSLYLNADAGLLGFRKATDGHSVRFTEAYLFEIDAAAELQEANLPFSNGSSLFEVLSNDQGIAINIPTEA